MAATRDLFQAARDGMALSHSPYSHFPVGAAIRTASGGIYAGCNVENASYPEGWCAETSAIAAMVMGGGGVIADILVVAEKKQAASPCGGCRQRISEFATAETRVHLCDANGVIETLTMAELLPKAFELETPA